MKGRTSVRWYERGWQISLPVAAAELVGFTKGAREEGGCGYGCAHGDDGCEEGCGVHGDWFGGEVSMFELIEIVLTVCWS